MPLREEFEDFFDAQANEPAAWIEVAHSLRVAARPVFARLREIEDDSPNIDGVRIEKLGCMRAYMLLTAAAFENMIKAIAVKRGVLIADGGQLSSKGSGFPGNGHALSAMASNLQLDLRAPDIDLLKRLEEYYLWAARYPVPNKASRSARAEKNQMLKLLTSDEQLSAALFDKLLRIALQAA